MEGTNVDDWPTPRVKLPQAREYAQLLSTLQLSILQSFQLYMIAMNVQPFMDKIEQDVNFQHQQTPSEDNKLLLV